MNLKIGFYSEVLSSEWISSLKEILSQFGSFDYHVIQKNENHSLFQFHILFIDSETELKSDAFYSLVQSQSVGVFLVTRETEAVSPLLVSGKIQGILVHPFRKIEVLSKLSLYQQMVSWNEVSSLNRSFSSLVQKLGANLDLAERMQKVRLKKRFPKVKGFEVHNRYLAGLRAGGDYFDLIESKDQKSFSIVMTDSSSYGLSSTILSIMMKIALKSGLDPKEPLGETLVHIQEELVSTLSEKDELSLFLGVVDRRDLSLKYLNLGQTSAYLAKKELGFKSLGVQGAALRYPVLSQRFEEGCVQLDPEDRLIILSDGFAEGMGAQAEVIKTMNELRNYDPKKSVNELAYQVKSKLEEGAMPNQDCSLLMMDVHSRVLRLAKS
ncbi:MAG: hypothetical protein CL678_12935 [Bdellovibrionaceae bacterium]|nr:hypothetical protein [Pseudobdellovibrionaceae bacterium]|tara:strand:+ start:15620 stop:16762 length:1143 start_codon:yes stop_codon:yes gene_type:complete